MKALSLQRSSTPQPSKFNMSVLSALLRAQLAAAERVETSQARITEIEAQLAALQQQLATARDAHAEHQAAYARARDASEVSTPPPPPGKILGVSDCHAYCTTGAWSLEATESSIYGVCITPSMHRPTANRPITLESGEEAQISEKRYAAAQLIKVGDTLYMGDKKRRAVFKGVVTAQPFSKPFRSRDRAFNGFRGRVDTREQAAGRMSRTFHPLEEEVEMNWEVKWTRVGDLTDAWKEYICYSHAHSTVRPLSGPPPTA